MGTWRRNNDDDEEKAEVLCNVFAWVLGTCGVSGVRLAARIVISTLGRGVAER